MAEVRTADVTWFGDLLTGSGTIDYVSSGVFSRMPVSWAARTGAHNGKTSPEELLAAAHAACFSMAFSARLAKNDLPVRNERLARIAHREPNGRRAKKPRTNPRRVVPNPNARRAVTPSRKRQAKMAGTVRCRDSWAFPRSIRNLRRGLN